MRRLIFLTVLCHVVVRDAAAQPPLYEGDTDVYDDGSEFYVDRTSYKDRYNDQQTNSWRILKYYRFVGLESHPLFGTRAKISGFFRKWWSEYKQSSKMRWWKNEEIIENRDTNMRTLEFTSNCEVQYSRGVWNCYLDALCRPLTLADALDRAKTLNTPILVIPLDDRKPLQWVEAKTVLSLTEVDVDGILYPGDGIKLTLNLREKSILRSGSSDTTDRSRQKKKKKSKTWLNKNGMRHAVFKTVNPLREHSKERRDKQYHMPHGTKIHRQFELPLDKAISAGHMMFGKMLLPVVMECQVSPYATNSPHDLTDFRTASGNRYMQCANLRLQNPFVSAREIRPFVNSIYTVWPWQTRRESRKLADNMCKPDAHGVAIVLTGIDRENQRLILQLEKLSYLNCRTTQNKLTLGIIHTLKPEVEPDHLRGAVTKLQRNGWGWRVTRDYEMTGKLKSMKGDTCTFAGAENWMKEAMKVPVEYFEIRLQRNEMLRCPKLTFVDTANLAPTPAVEGTKESETPTVATMEEGNKEGNKEGKKKGKLAAAANKVVHSVKGLFSSDKSGSKTQEAEHEGVTEGAVESEALVPSDGGKAKKKRKLFSMPRVFKNIRKKNNKDEEGGEKNKKKEALMEKKKMKTAETQETETKKKTEKETGKQQK